MVVFRLDDVRKTFLIPPRSLCWVSGSVLSAPNIILVSRFTAVEYGVCVWFRKTTVLVVRANLLPVMNVDFGARNQQRIGEIRNDKKVI